MTSMAEHIVFFAFISDNEGSWRALARQTFLNPANVRCLREESASYRFYVSSLHLQTGPDTTYVSENVLSSHNGSLAPWLARAWGVDGDPQRPPFVGTQTVSSAG